MADEKVIPVDRKEVWDPDSYQLMVEIDGTRFRFQSPTYFEMENLGLELLASTFGRYKADEIRKSVQRLESDEAE